MVVVFTVIQLVWVSNFSKTVLLPAHDTHMIKISLFIDLCYMSKKYLFLLLVLITNIHSPS